MLDSLNSRYYVAVSGVKHGFFEAVLEVRRTMSDKLQFVVVPDVFDNLKFAGHSESVSVPAQIARHGRWKGRNLLLVCPNTTG